MLKEAAKRFWTSSLEKMCRNQEQNMISKIQIIKKIDVLAKAKVSDFFLEKLKIERAFLNVNQKSDTKYKAKFIDNYPLHIAKSYLDKN